MANSLQEVKMGQSHLTSDIDYVSIYLWDSHTGFLLLFDGEKEDFWSNPSHLKEDTSKGLEDLHIFVSFDYKDIYMIIFRVYVHTVVQVPLWE